MNFGINQRNIRRTAVVMLFVWMMSLMLGFANACVLDNDHRSLRHVFVAATHANESKGESSRGVGSRDASVGLGACESFCSAQETGILKCSGITALIEPRGHKLFSTADSDVDQPSNELYRTAALRR
jgi:hypothetical protein